ncbi:MAG: hypothetical protein E7619_01690 [Ruminococcaceae bacterium]|nr:hypothetical protein [Oscillospiraceae bacterium]
MTDIEKRLDALKRAVDSLYDDRIRQRRMLADLLYNLDGENMPAVKSLIERHMEENSSAIAALTLRADENGAAIESIAAVQTEQAESIASVSQQADEASAQVAIAVEHANSANENVSNGAYIIARVNADGSGIRISADKLELDGYATFSDLEGEGQTVINGANIKTGTLYVDAIEVSPNNASGINLNKQTLFPNGIFFGDDVASWHLLESYIKAVTEGGVKVLKINASQSLDLSAGSGAVAGIRMYRGNIDGQSVFFCSPSGGSVAGYWTYNGSEIATKADLEALKDEIDGGSGDPCATGHTPEYFSNDDAASHTVKCSVCGKVLDSQEYCYDYDDGTGHCERCGQFIV